MSFLYSVFGLRLRANQLIPGLICLAEPSGTETDLEVYVGLKPPEASETRKAREQIWYVSSFLDAGGEPVLTIWESGKGTYFRFQYTDGTEFVIDRRGGRIWATWSAAGTVEDMATYLLGPVLGFVLRLRYVTCLHASAVAVGNQAIALLGAEGAGKSTTAAAFARLGYPILSDDVVAILERGHSFLVPPAYPYLSLWPDSVSFLYGSPDALPCLSPTWQKRYLVLAQEGGQFQRPPLPLGAIYILGARNTGSDAPFVATVRARDALMALVANTYGNKLLDKAMRAREFELLSRVAGRVPVRQVNPHTDPARLSKLCEVILEDLQVARPVSAALASSA